MRKKLKWGALVLACGMLLGAAGCAGSQACAGNQAQANTPLGGYEMTITSEMQGDTIVLLDGDIAAFALNYKKDGQGSAKKYANTKASQEELMVDRFAPKPATISWENTRDGALYYTVRVGLKKDLSDAQQYLTNDTTIDIDYLFVAKHYYYQIYAHYENDEVVKSQIFDFWHAICFIYILLKQNNKH